MKQLNKHYILTRVTLNDNGCWIWQMGLGAHGYAAIGIGQRALGTGVGHRVAYTLFKGPIPDGLTIDHLCNVRACLNPDHLEAVTQEENNRRRDERFIKENPLFECGHSREHYGFVRKSGKHPSGNRKEQLTCRPCYINYNRTYNERRKLCLSKQSI